MATVTSNVSDTALWVATYRAVESARPDAIFRDPLAAKLAGDKGREMVKKLSLSVGSNGWWMVARTKIIDDMIAACVSSGTDTVINLASGLDTRPYRLPLPPRLTWVEADLPAMVEEKERLLEGEKPVCRLVREKVDLANAEARRAFLTRVTAESKRVTVLAEGLLIYLEPETVRELARDLSAQPSIVTWITDLSSPGLLKMMQRQTRGQLSGSANFRFAPAEGTRFFEPLGWQAREVRGVMAEAKALKRLPFYLRPIALLPEPNPAKPGRRPWSGIVRCERG